MRLRVLFLTCHLPFPPVSGGRRREFELLRRIGREVDVSVCAISKTYEEDRSNAGALAPYCTDVRVVPAEPARASDVIPFQVLRHRSRHVRRALRKARYDVIHVEGFYLMQHLRHIEPGPTVLVEQNIEYQLWEQRAAHARGTAAWRHRREAERTRVAEQEAWRTADVVAALTEEDRAVIRASGIDHVPLVPDGIARAQDHLAPTVEGSRPVVTFIGNFAYEPNVDAAQHFVKRVLPRLVHSVPDVHVMLVGNAPSMAVRALAGRHVTVTGRVPDVGEYLQAATVVVCPLRVGGGVKVKMLEALAYSKAIVSTSVGTQGLGPGVHEAVVEADDPVPMAAAIAELLRDPQRRRSLEAAAGAHAATLPTWEDAAEALVGCYRLAATGRQPLDA
ncbi:MAG: glycosyltransferase [Nitriliruptorales bacterium]|nr:glycosyltransferase [Nitriliruptorales bacterium]